MSAQTIGEYIATLPPTPQQVAERAYVAERAPQLAALYLSDRRVMAAVMDDIAEAIECDPPKPADLPLLQAMKDGIDAAMGHHLRIAIARHVARRADDDASDEAAELYDVEMAA